MISSKWPSDKKLRFINWALLLFIVSCAAYIALMPIAPKAVHKVKKHFNPPKVISYNQPKTLESLTGNNGGSGNRLIIPTMDLNQPIYEGTDPKTVNKGIWHRPRSATPDQPSNTVLVGHRFSYSHKSILYFLDEVKVGDQAFVKWNGKLYAYQVDKISVVNPNDVYVESPTDHSVLTVYSCTPLWSTKHRLVIHAELKKVI